MDRRTFSKSLAAGALASGMSDAHGEERGAGEAFAAEDVELAAKPNFTARIPARPVAWPHRIFRRLLVDTHVPDWDGLLTHPAWRILPENGYDTQLFSRTGTFWPAICYCPH